MAEIVHPTERSTPMNALVFALALCAQAPPPQQVTLADGNVYQITYQRVNPNEGVPPPPAAGAPRSPAAISASAQSPLLAMAQPPAKQQPMALAPAPVAPSAQLQYTYTQPQTVAMAVQPVALSVAQPMAQVVLKQPCCLDRAISRVGLVMYQRGLPRLAVVPAPVTLQLQQSTVGVAAQPVQQFALASPQR
jgi:hypothetical protein